MQHLLTVSHFLQQGLTKAESLKLLNLFDELRQENKKPQDTWTVIAKEVSQKKYPFAIHLMIFKILFPDWPHHPETGIAWMPHENSIEKSNIFQFMSAHGFNEISPFHQWSYENYVDFWEAIIKQLTISFIKWPTHIVDLSLGLKNPQWFPDSQLNIAASCFQAKKDKIALIALNEKNHLINISYEQLDQLSNRVANSLVNQGFQKGDRLAIVLPMNIEAVALYFGIIKMGGVVVSIADSFSAKEIGTRFNISATQAVFTQEETLWNGKKIPLYPKVNEACEPFSSMRIFLLSHFFKALPENHTFTPLPMHPMDECHILFSSGTTAEPKAIVWNHTTPIKAASDAFFHHDVKTEDVLAWPTNLGWMMGPWLLFAGLINKSTIALYTDSPKEKAFGEFIQHSGVTILGLVPTLVSAWRQSKCMEDLNWEKIKLFSSSGECSNAEDMLYLMSLAGYRPIIEYCGGTEIGGAYLSSTIIQPNCPALFSTPTMGLNLIILDEKGKTTDQGEVAIIPPSIGLSTVLLNADHNNIYYDDMPSGPRKEMLRRHGDQIKRFSTGYYAILGRSDDTMNLGGIKVSAVEIERAISGIPDITESAAVNITSDNGQTQLIIFACTALNLDKAKILKTMQQKIKINLNPLFKIHDVIFVKALPKTASNKIMRRVLRKQIIG